MVTEIHLAPALDANLKPNFQNQLLDPKDSAKKLMRLLLINVQKVLMRRLKGY
jgi:hypothetical protein